MVLFLTQQGIPLGGPFFYAGYGGIDDVSIVGNQGDETAYGIALEIGGGGGTFAGQLLYDGNNFDEYDTH